MILKDFIQNQKPDLYIEQLANIYTIDQISKYRHVIKILKKMVPCPHMSHYILSIERYIQNDHSILYDATFSTKDKRENACEICLTEWEYILGCSISKEHYDEYGAIYPAVILFNMCNLGFKRNSISKKQKYLIERYGKKRSSTPITLSKTDISTYRYLYSLYLEYLKNKYSEEWYVLTRKI